MKNVLTILGLAALVAFTACNGPTGGRTDKGTGREIVGPGEGKFTFHEPTLSTHVKQGEKKEAKFSITRGTNFTDDVALEFGDLPKDLKIDPAHPVIKAGEKEVTVTVEATKDASPTDHEIKVTAKPQKGEPITKTFKVTVDKP